LCKLRNNFLPARRGTIGKWDHVLPKEGHKREKGDKNRWCFKYEFSLTYVRNLVKGRIRDITMLLFRRLGKFHAVKGEQTGPTMIVLSKD